MAPGPSTPYLELQERSDAIHRDSLVLFSAAAAGLVFGLAGFALRRPRWLVAAFRLLLLGAPIVSAGTLARVTAFDGLIERRGAEGQWVMGAQPWAEAVGPYGGRWFEDEPGLASDPLPQGDFLTLDRHTLARKRPDGTFRWIRPRPARSPAHLLVAGDEVMVAGPGLGFPDDLVVAAFSLDDGRERFAYHWLGDRLLLPALEGDALLLCSLRPSSATLRLLRWPMAEAVWRLALPLPPEVAPRLRGGAVELALGGEIWTLDRASGRVLERRNACRPPTGEVACQAGRVSAWEPGGNS